MTVCSIPTRTGLASILLSVAASAASAQTYIITDLGDLPGGGNYSVATALNELGQVVGYSDAAPDTRFGDDGNRPFIWDAVNGMQNLAPFAHRASYAYGINESGVVVGQWTDPNRAEWFSGFQWNSAAGFVDLGVAGSYPYSAVTAINDHGYMVQQNWNFYGPPSRLYLRSPSGMLTDIGTAPGVSSPISGDINNANQIVGSNYTSGSYVEANAFRWDPTTGMTVIGPLAGGTQSFGNAINESGAIVGVSTVASGATHPFVWDPVNGIRDLGVFAAGTPYGAANGINDLGVVVGGSTAGNTPHAFSWTSGSGLVDLNDCLVDSTGWQYLVNAYDINNAGQIVGYGVLTSGETHAFLLTPTAVPEPSTYAAILGTVALCVVALRRRQRA